MSSWEEGQSKWEISHEVRAKAEEDRKYTHHPHPHFSKALGHVPGSSSRRVQFYTHRGNKPLPATPLYSKTAEKFQVFKS